MASSLTASMPHPDPNGLSIDEREDGSFSITAEVWQHGNRQQSGHTLTCVLWNSPATRQMNQMNRLRPSI